MSSLTCNKISSETAFMQTEEKSPCNSDIYTGDFVTDNSYIKMI